MIYSRKSKTRHDARPAFAAFDEWRNTSMNQQQQKMITQLTDQELLQIGQNDPVTAGKIKSVFEQGIEQIRYQLEYIRETLSDFTQRTALLMTIAGLLAFLPPFVGFGTDYLLHFLIWTFPFLILSSRKTLLSNALIP